MKGFNLPDLICLIIVIMLSLTVGILISPYVKTMTESWIINQTQAYCNTGFTQLTA